jgi:hypothetical protein
VSDVTPKPPARLSLRKSSATAPPPGSSAPQAARPRQVVWAIVALAVSAVSAIVAALALYGQRDWLINDQKKANATTIKDAAKNHKAAPKKLPDPAHHASQVMSSQLIGSLLVVAVIAFLAYGVYRGRHWSWWGVSGFWILSSLTGTVVGLGGLLGVGSTIPAPYRVPAFVAAVALVAAVAFVNMRPSRAYFALNKPVGPDGAPMRRGLFAPRPQGGPGGSRAGAGRTGAAARAGAGKSVLTSTAAERGDAYVERQRSKKRATANAESVARGAELARSRAKASKSRRLES